VRERGRRGKFSERVPTIRENSKRERQREDDRQTERQVERKRQTGSREDVSVGDEEGRSCGGDFSHLFAPVTVNVDVRDPRLAQ